MTSSDSPDEKYISSTPAPQISKSSKTSRLSWAGILPTLFIILVTAGIATLILVWLYLHYFHLTNLKTGETFGKPTAEGYFALDEGFESAAGEKGVNGLVAVMRILTFSVIASHLVSLASSFLMILVAYRTASQWLHVCEAHSDDESKFPTPLQYGLLIRLLGGSGISALWKTLQYAYQGDRNRAQLPRIFVDATRIATVIFILTHLVGITDLWLHNVASSIIVSTPNQMFDLQNSDNFWWSTVLNASDPEGFGLCSPWTASPWPCLNTPAGWADDNPGDDTVNNPELVIAYLGWQTAYNITELAEFVTVQLPTEDSASILLPWDAGSGNNFNKYTSATYGASASCKIITNECATDPSTNLTISCAPAGYPQLPVVGAYASATNTHPSYQSLLNSTTYNISNPTFNIPSRVLGLVDGHLAGLGAGMADLPPASALTDNPATTLLQLHWSSYYGDTALPVLSVLTDDDGDNAPTFDTFPPGFHTLYAVCSLEYFRANVTFDTTPGQGWSLGPRELLDRNLTSILWSPLMAQYATESMAAEIMGIASSNTRTNTTLKLNQLLGRLAISFPSGLFDSDKALSVETTNFRILALYPIGPICLLVSVLYLYSLFAIYIFVTTRTVSSYAIVIPPELILLDQQEVGRFTRLMNWAMNTWPLSIFKPNPNESNALALGQLWLTDPIPFVSAMFPEGDGLDGKRTAATDALLTHKDTRTGTQRLEMGIFERNHEMVFGVKVRDPPEGSG